MVETIPIFPLGTVLLPGASLPLHIFEPRYRQLTTDLVTGAVPGRCFGVVAVRPGFDPNDGDLDALHHVGCTARIQEVRRLPDGRFDIVTVGERRFTLLGIDSTSAPYHTGTVEWVPDSATEEVTPQLMPALVHAARSAHHRYCQVAWKRDDWDSPADDVDPAALAHLLASDALLPLDDKQALLEETSHVRRLRMLRALLARETTFLSELRAVPVPLGQLDAPGSLN
ncbi:LON peptidase substrate-binding domain-containing protein [Rhodococcus aerolatus]